MALTNDERDPNSEDLLLPAEAHDRAREVSNERSTLTPVEKWALMLRVGLRAGWDDPEMDVYNDLDPRLQR